MKAQPDILIAGGGMVGATLACALARPDRRIWVVERGTIPEWGAADPPDLRVSAISLANQQYLERLGIWPLVDTVRYTPYESLATWEWLKTPWGVSLPPKQATRFHAAELKVPRLGVIVENRALQRAALERATQLSGVQVLTKQAVEDLKWEDGRLHLHVSGRWLSPGLVVGADGAHSRIREAARMPLTTHPYDQWAMLINVTVAQPLPAETWQAFTPEGPRALLPLGSPDEQHWASLVWYDAPEVIQAMTALPPDELKYQIQAHFPPELPAVRAVHAAGAFPLIRRHAQTYTRGNVVLIGDAAHTINPLAGQGVNLGFQDVAELARTLEGWHPGSEARSAGVPEAALKAYSRKRHRANVLMMHGMDVFHQAFSNRFPPLALARNLGLALAHRAGPAKRKVLAYALGLEQPL